MSFYTWREEFYPTPASVAATGTVRDVISNSLTKWQGLTREAIAKHGLEKVPDRGDLTAEGILVFGVDCDSCSLCHAAELARECGVVPIKRATSYHVYDGFEDESCEFCLLARYNGRGCIDEYQSYSSAGNAEPMIRILNTAMDAAIRTGEADQPSLHTIHPMKSVISGVLQS